MSAVMIPSSDRENATAQVNGKQKISSLRGVTAAGMSEQLAVQANKKFGVCMGGLDTSQRSFGDISNRIGRVNPEIGTCAGKKMHTQPVLTEAWKSFPGTEADFQPEPEFIPEIIETEDYSDVLPLEYCLSQQDIAHLVNFCGAYHKSEPSSPPRSCLLMQQVQFKPILRLEPVLEEVYDLPPVWD